MSSARDQILGGIRKALKREALAPEAVASVEARLAHPARNLIPARTTVLDHEGQVELFIKMAKEVQTTVSRVASPADVPAAVVDYLAQNNLPAEIAMAPDPSLDAYPWAE